MIYILAESVIAKNKKTVKYYADDGAIVTSAAADIQIFETQEELDSAYDAAMAELDEQIAASDDEEEAEEGEEEDDDEWDGDEDVEPGPLDQAEAEQARIEAEQEPEAPATPAPRKPRGKGANSVKERQPMATAVAKARSKSELKKAAAKKASTNRRLPTSKSVSATTSGTLTRTIAGRELDLSGYEKITNASGNTSYDVGDDTAVQLRGLPLDDVYARASKVLGETAKALKARYSHLNPGMQRMTLGNRMRAAAKAKAA